MDQTTFYLLLSAVLFTIGSAGVLVRKNAITIFMCIELMLNAVNLTFVALAQRFHALDGQIYVFFVMAIAAAGKSVKKDLLVICHGGPFDEPDAVGSALAKMPGIAGFFGATSIERLPTERAITGQVKEFKGMALG